MGKLAGWAVKHPAWGVFWVSFILLSINLPGAEVLRIDVRFALMVQELAKYPIGFFPTINGSPYADYTVPYIYLSYLSTLGGRWVNAWSLALPSLLLAGYLFSMTYLLGEKIRPYCGLMAVVMLYFTPEFIGVVRCFSLDITVAAATITIAWLQSKKIQTVKDNIVIGLLLIAAFFMRGPIGLVMTGTALAGMLAFQQRWKAFFAWGVVGGVISVFCAAAAYGIIYRQGGQELLNLMYAWQIGDRFQDGQKYLYYFTNAVGSYVLCYPLGLAVWVVCGKKLFAFRSDRGKDAEWLRFLCGWYLLPVIIISIPDSSHLRYITLVMPALALTAAYGFMVLTNFSWRKYVDKLFYLLGMTAIVGGLAGALIMPWIVYFIAPAADNAFWNYLLIPVIGLAAWRFKVWEPTRIFGRMAVSGAAAMLIWSGVMYPIINLRETAAEFVHQAEAERLQGRVFLYNIEVDHDDLKYILSCENSRRDSVYYLYDKPLRGHLKTMYPVLGNYEYLKSVTPADVVIMRDYTFEKFDKLHPDMAGMFTKVAEGRMGHREFVAVKRTK